ncbi:alpha-1,3-mannosyltransferase CMT1 [Mariannaea sp. PMI_226]|nr:alpha-1,3-mannosyltransferase CMT1 [Mariannaea sp. PMI_226]
MLPYSYYGRDHVSLPSLPSVFSHDHDHDHAPSSGYNTTNGEVPQSCLVSGVEQLLTLPEAPIILNNSQISTYLKAIVKPNSTRLDYMKCPTFEASRYDVLKVPNSTDRKIHYFFPLNFREKLDVVVTLFNGIIEAMKFLGPENCALSVVEGNSPDGTAEVLEALRPTMEKLGIAYFYQTTALNPSDGDRIPKLAKLRNAALEPMFDNRELLAENATVVFLNDVALCVEDILELIFQLRNLDADMTCGMDWNTGESYFLYDTWITRGINGDAVFNTTKEMSWAHVRELFWNDPATLKRFSEYRPFQVFSCWNGGVTFRAQPMLDGLRFRAPDLGAGECVQGEPQTFCKDLWFLGYGKIAMIPTVNFAYSNDGGRDIKGRLGFVSDRVRDQDLAGDQIEWLGPPDQVKCIEPWSKQYWQTWNATLV